MIDRHTDHRAEAELMLAEAHAWAAVAGEPTPESNELAYITYAAVHALLAIHDTLTAADRYAANEAKQREAGADPLDEDDHRDRMSGHVRLVRVGHNHWHTPRYGNCHHGEHGYSLDEWDSDGPLTFAPEPAQDATGGDLSAPEGENGAEEGGDTDNAQKAILCPECGHHIHTHDMDGCLHILCCPRTPEDVARALIDLAVKAAREAATDG